MHWQLIIFVLNLVLYLVVFICLAFYCISAVLRDSLLLVVYLLYFHCKTRVIVIIHSLYIQNPPKLLLHRLAGGD